MKPFIMSFDFISMGDPGIARGKNASFGEITGVPVLGISVPNAFAITLTAYNEFQIFE